MAYANYKGIVVTIKSCNSLQIHQGRAQRVITGFSIFNKMILHHVTSSRHGGQHPTHEKAEKSTPTTWKEIHVTLCNRVTQTSSKVQTFQSLNCIWTCMPELYQWLNVLATCHTLCYMWTKLHICAISDGNVLLVSNPLTRTVTNWTVLHEDSSNGCNSLDNSHTLSQAIQHL